jgi:hypothetical protein
MIVEMMRALAFEAARLILDINQPQVLAPHVANRTHFLQDCSEANHRENCKSEKENIRESSIGSLIINALSISAMFS